MKPDNWKEMLNLAERFDVLNAFKKHYSKYINRFMGLKCAGDLLNLGVFPNAKEITETFSMFTAWNKHLMAEFQRNDKNIALVSVGDGRKPRTAAFFAYMTPWQCYSVDPNLHQEFQYNTVKRLFLHPKQVEEVDLDFDKVLIVAVHSHATIKAILEHIHAKRRALIALPCCDKSYYKYTVPDLAYNDVGVWSPMRTVLIWRNI